MKRPFNTVTILPERISADHYRIASFTRPGKTYDLVYHYELHKWVCNCPDTTKNYNSRCKHCQLLITWIAAQEQQQLAQRQATQIAASLEPSPLETALSEALQRIEALERQRAQQDAEIEALHTRLAFIQRNEQEIKGLQRDIIILRKQCSQQTAQLAEQDETVNILQSQQCKTNEHRFKLGSDLGIARSEIESLKLITQTQAEINQQLISQIEQIADQLAQLPTQPCLEIRVSGASMKRTGKTSRTRSTKQPKQAKDAEPAPRIQEVRRGDRLTALKIDMATLKIIEGCIVGACNCKDAQKGLTCLHEQEAWSYLKNL